MERNERKTIESTDIIVPFNYSVEDTVVKRPEKLSQIELYTRMKLLITDLVQSLLLRAPYQSTASNLVPTVPDLSGISEAF